MAFRTEAVANAFLGIAWGREEVLTAMKLQMLVYFAQGWHLVIRDKPLIDEQIEATGFGLVIPSLLDCFEEYGDRPVDEKLTHLVAKPAENGSTYDPLGYDPLGYDPFGYVVTVPEIDENSDDAVFARSLIQRVWDVYGHYTAGQLSKMTRQPGAPWREVWEKFESKPPRGTDIPMESIRQYFVNLAKHEPQQAVSQG